MSTISSRIPTFVRLALGAVFFVFGLNGFLQFLPQPPMTESAGQFAGALFATGYMFPLIKSIEVVAGVLLLSGRFVPLALTVLAPIIVNIALFHIVLQPALPMVVFLLGAEIYLAYSYRSAFSGVLQAQAQPVQAPPRADGRLAHVS
jgi:uncharacterized membrane protein YphA (DoxX/SURF4 family)